MPMKKAYAFCRLVPTKRFPLNNQILRQGGGGKARASRARQLHANMKSLGRYTHK